MSKELTRKGVPARRRFGSRNTMSFPRALRDAIPDLPTYVGRVLEIDSVSGKVSSWAHLSPLFTTKVQLKLVVKETGKLKGQFAVLIDLEPDAARQLAATLTHLSEEAEKD